MITNTDVPKTVLNAKGEPLPGYLYAKLVDANKTHREGGGCNTSYAANGKDGRGGGRGLGRWGGTRRTNVVETNPDTHADASADEQLSEEYVSSDDECPFPGSQANTAESTRSAGPGALRAEGASKVPTSTPAGQMSADQITTRPHASESHTLSFASEQPAEGIMI